MKWFKHHSSLRNSEGVAKILDKGGIEAYGAFCMVCELVAENMTAADQACSLTLPSGRWAKELGMHRNRVARLLRIIAGSGMCITTKIDGGFKVAVPILAKWRDEYSKKSGHTPDTKPTLSTSEGDRKGDRELDAHEDGDGDRDRGAGKEKEGIVVNKVSSRNGDIVAGVRNVAVRSHDDKLTPFSEHSLVDWVKEKGAEAIKLRENKNSS